MIGCHRRAGWPRGRGAELHVGGWWGPWGPIMGATSSLAILPQIATLKRGTAPEERREESADCSVHRLRLAATWSVLQLGPPSALFFRLASIIRFPSPPSFPLFLRIRAARNTVIGQFRSFPFE